MKWSDLAGVVSKFAPVIGTAIGGPPGALVGSMIATALGVEDSPEAVAKELKHNPEAYVKLKQLESDERLKLQGYANDALVAELADKGNARDTHKHSQVPAYLSALLSAVIIGIIYLLFYSAPPEGSRDVLFMVLGVVIKEWGGAMQYWFGTTRSSAQKTMMMKKG